MSYLNLACVLISLKLSWRPYELKIGTAFSERLPFYFTLKHNSLTVYGHRVRLPSGGVHMSSPGFFFFLF